MRSRIRLVALLATALLCAGCGGGADSAPRPSASSGSHLPAAPLSTSPPPTPRQLVEDPESLLYGSFIRRDGDAFDVTTVWACNQNTGDCPRRSAIAHSDDDFVTVDYTPGGSRRARAALAPDRPGSAGRYKSCVSAAAALMCIGAVEDDAAAVAWTRDGGATWESHELISRPNLLASPVTSLRSGTFAVEWGGDGATVLPFERVSRSEDGHPWATVDVTRPNGVVAYTSGSVVTSDGRLFTLLDTWSDDLHGKPSARPHGLYASSGSDWSSYRPMTSRFQPPLNQAPRHWSPIVTLQANPAPDPVIWVTTWDRLLYVSTDDGRSFRQIRAR